MKKRIIFTVILEALLLALITILPVAAISQQQTPSQSSKPNIIIIVVDDLGYGDLQSYGGEIPTPNIDRIGKQGIRFTDFYAASPVCTPSRFGLLTGRYPHRSKHGLTFALLPGDTNYLDTTEYTLARLLKQGKYKTGMVGKWHLGMQSPATKPTDYGFDYFTGMMGGCVDYFQHNYGSMGADWYVNNQPVTEKGYATELLTNHAIDFLRSAHRQQPFFLYLAYNAPHYGKTDSASKEPYTISLEAASYKGHNNLNTLQAPEKYLKRFTSITNPYRRTYAAMVACLDDNIGRLLNWMEKNDLLNNTIIWFISDNGGYAKTHQAHASNGALRGEKGQLWEGGIRVPAMVMWKGHIEKGQQLKTPVCNIDVLPTMLKIAGGAELPVAGSIDGTDISALLFKQQQQLQRELYWEYNKQAACRLGDWKLVYGRELYNLKDDPGEKNDLSEKYPEKVKELKALQEKIKAAK